jgi:phosphatidylglycerol:prolipoprotein diacylglycerol transferase
MIGYAYWNPPREMFPFNLPLIDRPILWYGFLFAAGFFVAYWVLVYLLKGFLRTDKKGAVSFAEKISLYTILGGLIGARLGDVFFYQSPAEYLRDPLSIIKVWEGGLASHGGAAGILIALFLLSRKLRFSWLSLLDLAVIPTAIAAFFIRIGNFFNQEILGTPTQLPWAIIFGHPADGSAAVPRHPVQLYEAFYYLSVFFLLGYLWRSKPSLRQPGRMCGLFLILVFAFRFLIEFLKLEQSALLTSVSFLDMGQYLSLPLIVLGFFLFYRKKEEITGWQDVQDKE